jgi:archaeal type IV pilus assembly protein PilA
MIKGKGPHVHQAVAPIIATLLLIAIAVVGGTIISLYSNNVLISAQVSGSPSIELVKILGHDTRDGSLIADAYEQYLAVYSGGLADGSKKAGERVSVFVQNHGVKDFVINELRFSGKEYTFTPNVDTLGWYFFNVAPARGEFVILLDSPDVLLDSSTPIIEPGQTVTLVIGLDQNIKIGRNAQIKITSNHGSSFVGEANIGEFKN